MAITKLMDGLPNQSMSQADFDQATGKYMSDLPAWGGEANALAADVNAKQVAAAASATAADASRAASATQAGNSAASAATAATQAGIATAKAADAAVQVVAATAKAGEAAASAAASANSATGLIATSTTSLVMGNGTQVLTVPAGKQFPPAAPLALVSAGAPTNKMFGTVASYSGTTLTMTITKTEGTGTFNDWTISPAGAYGPTGGTAGGQLTSALDEKKGADLASAATIDPWSTGGNLVSLTGSAAITAIANAPQAGAKRTLLVVGAPSITASANLVVKGGSLSLAAGDEIDIEAETVTKFRITIRRGDGTPTTPIAFRNCILVTQSQVFVAKADGPIRFTLSGPCGTGAVLVSTDNANLSATGGGVGGFGIKTVYGKAGDAYVITLTAGGVSVSKDGVTGSGGINGNDGAGPATIVGPNASMTANPGRGGKFLIGAGTAPGGLGGTFSGGDINITGAAAGSATTSSVANGYSIAATGGACIGFSGVSYSSGAAAASVTVANGRAFAATGGAGVGGKSGDATSTATSLGDRAVFSGGAGAYGASANNAAPGSSAPAGVGSAQAFPVFQGGLPLYSAGTEGRNGSASSGLSAASGAGGGSGASYDFGSGGAFSGSVFFLGGSGAAIISTSSGNFSAISGTVNFGGASGAAILVGIGGANGGSATAQSGGAAYAIVEFN
ncbi:hypothetical protein GTP55_25720 [Duganella sp. FT109W]|uniref:Tail fiber protein n=1 Tax=Duganella margarita TaxID=2692170 RepID=A0ABW9WNE4_9BURK|nr:hypothetical protein [Duganella margarita]MYN42747.1 hypothetical protein [Duganella margarita]